MLICVDFCSHKVWGLKLCAEAELPLPIHHMERQNGGQFIGVITPECRAIPPGRPESNFISFDLTSPRWQVQNSWLLWLLWTIRQVPGWGYSPEDFWRLLGPSRWRHVYNITTHDLGYIIIFFLGGKQYTHVSMFLVTCVFVSRHGTLL